MRTLSFLCLVSLVSCAHKAAAPQKAEPNPNFAEATLVGGHIQARAMRSSENQSTCFAVTISTQKTPKEAVQVSNWSAALKDQRSRFHLLSINQRDPASVPSGSFEKWTNQFKICASEARYGTVRSLILTPKEYGVEGESLELKWD